MTLDIEEEGNRILLRSGDEAVSWLEFEERGDTIEVAHVYTPEEERGKGYAAVLVERALPLLQKRGEILVSCPYVRYWAEKNDYPGPLRFSAYLRFREAVREFNRYHAPEAEAEIISREGDRVTLEMTGSACRSCGGYDYLEDVIVDLEAEVESHEEIDYGLRAVYCLKEDDEDA